MLHLLSQTRAGHSGPADVTSLSLSHAKVTDEGLKELKELKKLSHLDLGDTAVTDEGLKELKDFPNRKWLGLHKTKVTSKGVKELKKALPYCYISEEDPEDRSKMERRRERASSRPYVSSATIYTVVEVFLAALAIIAPAIYVATKVRQRTKRL